MTPRTAMTMVFAICAVSYGAWTNAPLPEKQTAKAVADEPWKLPGDEAYDPKPATETLVLSGLWGKAIEKAASEPPIDASWVFLGAMARGKESYVIVQVLNKPPQQLAVGSELPGGSKILKIENNLVQILVNGKKQSLSIYAEGRQTL
jgi:hypothetical protein